MSNPPTVFWWRAMRNWGDAITPLLLDHFSDLRVDWALAKDADAVCLGSILEAVNAPLVKDWAGVVAGTGKLHERTVLDLPRATVLGVRGPLTALGLKGDYAIGDPGILADELVSVEKEYKLGLVPHWTDKELVDRPEFKPYDPVLIPANGDPLETIRQIGRCRKIVTSSLHGVIVADAFGIPRRTEIAASRLTREGGTFKYRDYNASVGVDFELGVTQVAARFRVQNVQHETYDMLVALGDLLRRDR